MGCGLKTEPCATFATCRAHGAAGAATPSHFAPLRHLRHPLIGEGQVPQWRNTTARARAATHSGGARSDGAYGLPTIRSPAHHREGLSP